MTQSTVRREHLSRLVWIAGVLLLAGPARGADPQLGGIEPYGLQRGTETVVTFSGARLEDTEALLLYRPGITVKDVVPAKDKEPTRATLVVAPDCPLGLHAVRLRTATGISNLRLFSVGALPQVAEQEPNSEFGSPQAIALGTTVNGIVQNEDVDYYVVEAKKGQRISVEVEGVRLGNDTFFDPYVAILNPERYELARCDDAALARQDCLCAVIAPADGKYVIETRECAYGGNGNCKYRLHVGSFPRPTAVLPGGGPPGQPLNVQWIGDVAGDWSSRVALPSGEQSEFGLFAEDPQGVAPSPNTIRVNGLTNLLEAEPNDGRDNATAATVPGAWNGVIGQPGDVDQFKFTAQKGQVLDVRVYGRQVLRSPLDGVLTITRADGGGVVSNDDTGGPDPYVRFTAPNDGEYFAVLTDQLRNGAPDYVYRIEVVVPAPALTLTLPERVQYVPVTVSVPRGGRMATMVNAARANFGGELQIALEGLPAGMAVEPVKMAANASSVPLLFTAAAEASNSGALADLVGRTTDPNQNVVGHLNQRTMLVRGRNNIDVFGHDADRMAVAVTQPAPFSVEIVQPKVPIVRNGSMQLKVTAQRHEGFQQPIAVFLLYNPPGIGSSGAVVIPPDQTEATIPLTANGRAEIGQWPLIVLGQATVGGGKLEVASQQAQLEIADMFVQFTFDKAAAELGQVADVLVRLEVRRPFEGAATAELLGVPAKTAVEGPPLEFTKDTKELVFKVKIDPAARPGKQQTLVCRAVLVENGEPITQTLGSGELRIDQPLPPKVETPQAKPEPKPAAEPAPQPPAERPLSRLEQLRQQRAQPGGGK